MTLAVDDPRHGTGNGYKNLGCRCVRCCKANTEMTNEYRHRTGRTKPRAEWLATLTIAPHGTETRYSAHGCRCDECKAVASKVRQERRLREDRAELRRKWREWKNEWSERRKAQR